MKLEKGKKSANKSKILKSGSKLGRPGRKSRKASKAKKRKLSGSYTDRFMKIQGKKLGKTEENMQILSDLAQQVSRTHAGAFKQLIPLVNQNGVEGNMALFNNRFKQISE